MPGVHVVAVVTVGSTPVGGRAGGLSLPVLAPRSLRDPQTVEEIASLGAQLGVLADYGRIVPSTLIARFVRGILNVHPSLLPRWRGAAPIAATIAAGDGTAGVSIIAMDAGIDTGPIVAAESWPLAGDEDAQTLRALASERGAGLLRATIGPWIRGEIEPIPQPEASATRTRPLSRDDGRLDPRLPAVVLERLVRALRPWPGCHLETAIGRLIVLEVRVCDSASTDLVGMLIGDADTLTLATSAGRLALTEVQPAGGRPMSGAELLRGRGRSLPGTTVIAAGTMVGPWMTSG